MKMSPRIVLHEPIDVAARLAELGLSIEMLHEAVAMGQTARNSCTPNDPASSVGMSGWGRTVRGLRESGLRLGWERYTEDNIDGVINKTKSMVVTVATGDTATGRIGSTPKTKYSKGANTQYAVQRNQLELPFFANVVPIKKGTTPAPKRLLWMLLYCQGEEEIRCELSLPDSIGEDERVETWAERIVLPPLPLDSGAKFKVEPDSESDIEVVVTRKG
jgi:hypothetical protein